MKRRLGLLAVAASLALSIACGMSPASSMTVSAPAASGSASSSAVPTEIASASPSATPAAALSVPRPHIHLKLIRFGALRKAQMATYSLRHYGKKTWVMTDPKVIVEHYTAGPTFMSAWWTFENNTPNLGELPGVCAQFIIDTNGTIYQLVDMRIRCRHTVGLNYTAIGIEHVGMSDAQVLHDAAQMRASLHLTVWLMARYGIQVRNVIGHAEALMSPYHHELIPSWRCQVHGDWQHSDMKTYRALLKAQARKYGVPVGPPPHWVTPHC